jgi:radical SAM enzyme (TIGR01210 family)
MSRFSALDYPADPDQRTEWIVTQRPERNRLDPSRPYAFLVEEERSAAGELVPVATIFLTNRECPWRCAMCDLWKNTLTEPVEPGAILRQIQFALERLPPARQIKLYNSGSFFDDRAIPREEDGAIADLVRRFERVIVECHPALVGERCFAFHTMLGRPLEVAMGLETAHPEVLEKLNKRMTVDQFARAADKLRAEGIDLRVFLLVQPPFLRTDDAPAWVQRSVDFAFECGATAVSLIPTRGGNGAMEALTRIGAFSTPPLLALEEAVEYGIGRQRGRVFADLWDLRQSTAHCAACWPQRIARLDRMNRTQQVAERTGCETCGGRS